MSRETEETAKIWNKIKYFYAERVVAVYSMTLSYAPEMAFQSL